MRDCPAPPPSHMVTHRNEAAERTPLRPAAKVFCWGISGESLCAARSGDSYLACRGVHLARPSRRLGNPHKACGGLPDASAGIRPTVPDRRLWTSLWADSEPGFQVGSQASCSNSLIYHGLVDVIDPLTGFVAGGDYLPGPSHETVTCGDFCDEPLRQRGGWLRPATLPISSASGGAGVRGDAAQAMDPSDRAVVGGGDRRLRRLALRRAAVAVRLRRLGRGAARRPAGQSAARRRRPAAGRSPRR